MEICKRFLLLLIFYMLTFEMWIFATFWGINLQGIANDPCIFSLVVPILIFSVPVFYPLAIWGYVTK